MLQKNVNFLVAGDFQNDFGSDSSPHMIEFRVAAQVGKRLDDKGRPDHIGVHIGNLIVVDSLCACQVVLMMERRDVCTLRDVHENGIVLPCYQIVAFQGSP